MKHAISFCRFTSTAITKDKILRETRKKEYREENSAGFVVDDIDADSIHLRHVECFDFEDVVEQPFGDPVVYKQRRYNVSKFTLVPKQGLILTHGSTRTSRHAINLAQSASGFSVTIEDTVINPCEWIKRISKEFPGLITQASFETTKMIPGCRVAVLAISEGIDAAKAAKEHLSISQSEIHRLRFASKIFTLEISSIGSMKVTTKEPLETLLPVFRETYLAAMR